MYARLSSYCEPSALFQNNVFWDTGGTPYINVNYLDIRFARPRLDIFQEVNEDGLKRRISVFQRQRIETDFSILVRNEFVDYFSRIGLNDTVQIDFLETGESYILQNVRMADETEPAELVGVVKFTFDLVSVTSTGCGESLYTLGACP